MAYAAYVFCNQCGHRNPPESNFCSSCGAAIDLDRDDRTIVFHPVDPSQDAPGPVDDVVVNLAELPPGGRFVSEAEWGQSGGFMFTACPVGYKPNVAFSVENKDAIGLSLYNCVGGKPNS